MISIFIFLYNIFKNLKIYFIRFETNYKREYCHFHDQYMEQPKYTYKNLITQKEFTSDCKIKGAKNAID